MFNGILGVNKKRSLGPTEIRTRITGFRVLGAAITPWSHHLMFGCAGFACFKLFTQDASVKMFAASPAKCLLYISLHSKKAAHFSTPLSPHWFMIRNLT